MAQPPFSPFRVVPAGSDIIFLSGEIGRENGQLVGEDMRSQALQCLCNITAILASAGLGWVNVVSVQVFLTDLGNYDEFNSVYTTYLREMWVVEGFPARCCIGVAALPINALVEIAARPARMVTLSADEEETTG